MAFCNMCGAQIADGTTTCAACAGSIPTAPVAAASAPAQGMADNVAGMLAYITIIPAIIFSGDGALQQEPIHPLPCIPVPVLRCRADHTSHRSFYLYCRAISGADHLSIAPPG